MTTVVNRAETHWMLARAQVNAGDNDDAIASIGRALASADLPGEWQARMLAFLAMLQRNATGDLNVADATALKALAIAGQAGDAFATAHALADLWLTHSVRRDHAAALGYLDRALHVLDFAGHPDLRSFILNARIFTLQNLDRWPQTELAVKQAREFATRSWIPDSALWATAAVLRYWPGQWDDALAELGAGETENDADTYLRERWPALLGPGVAALITGRRDQRMEADRYLRQGLARPIQTLSDRENQDFLVAAEALALEQRGKNRQAKVRLATLLSRREGEMTLLHQWLPDLVRLALAAGDSQTAQAAAQACQAEAAAETRVARAAAACLRCRGLLDFDADALRDAVAHYRTVGPAVELPAALGRVSWISD
jgi:tetratricopeptide (TPR) repeat protein